MARPLLPNDGTSERQYLDLVRAIVAHGDPRVDRTGVGTVALHGEVLRFDLSDGTWPLLTTKKVRWKDVVKELLWFLAGTTNIRPLLEQGVTIWSEWPHRRYVQETGEHVPLKEFEARVVSDADFAAQWGDLGPVYGKQWRRWAGPDGKQYDQLADLIERLRRDPYSRRLLFHGWNVAEIDRMALPPCHLLYQFFVERGRLSCTLYQRSCDVGLGLPYNLPSAALLTCMLAQQVGLSPGCLFWVGHDVHLYANHIDTLVSVQLSRSPRPFPKLDLKPAATLFDYTPDHVSVFEYRPHPAIALKVAV